MADRVKRWFRGKKDKSRSRSLPKDPYWGDKRSRHIPRSWESSHTHSLERPSLYISQSPAGSTEAPSSSRSRTRTPNGDLSDYYLEGQDSKDHSLNRKMQNGYVRSNSEPRFQPENMDSRLRARDHGYYIRAAGLNEGEASRQNVRLIYDRSRVTSPSRSGYPSGYISPRHDSNGMSRNESKSSSFRDKQRLYRPNKRSAPLAPSGNTSRQNSNENHQGTSDVVNKIMRKKRKAPPPPPFKRSWSEPPLEPPIDYDKENIPVVEAEVHTPAEPDTKPPTTAPPPPPPPPPLPPLGFKREKSTESLQGPPLPPKTEEEPPKPKQHPGITRMDSVLEKDIVKAAKARSRKGLVEPPESQYRNSFMAFANELATAVGKRNKRRGIGTLNMRHISRSKMFKAQPSKSDLTPLMTPEVDAMLGRANENGVVLRRSEDELRKLRQSARVQTYEWTPEQDLDEVFDSQPMRTHTHRGSDYYDIETPLQNGSASGDKDHNLLYKNAKYAKPNRNSKRKSSNLEKLKKSIGKAFGSIGKSLHKKGDEVEDLYLPEEGWQIQYTLKVEPPPSGPIAVKSIEKYPAYAYHPDKGQLVLLPEYDRIVVAEDGRRFREKEAPQLPKEMSAVLGFKQRPSLHGLFDTGGVVQKAPAFNRVEKERTEIELMEDQFALVRSINKRETKPPSPLEEAPRQWRSTPNLNGDLHTQNYDRDGVLSDHEADKLKSKKKKRSLKKSKKSSTSSDRNSPRQKVLRKGLDYYLKQGPRSPNTPNPVYSSEDEGMEHSDPNSESSNGKNEKADSLGDSGIGPESFNGKHTAINCMPAFVHGQPIFYTSPMIQHPPVVMAGPGYPTTAKPVTFQTMYYPYHSLDVPTSVPAHTMGVPTSMPTQPFILPTTHVQTLNHVTYSNASAATMTPVSTLTRPHPSSTLPAEIPSSPPVPITTPTSTPTASTLGGSSSKVISVNENISLVSYNDSNPASSPKENADSEAKEALSRTKQYLMGPVGYRPVNFNPNVKSKPVTLPDLAPSVASKESVPYPFGNSGSETNNKERKVLNSPIAESAPDTVVLNASPKASENGNNNSEVQILNKKSSDAVLLNSSTGKPEKDENENVQLNGHGSDSLSHIPTEVLEKYGHENLVAL